MTFGPDAQLIASLEALLERARSGEILAVAVAMVKLSPDPTGPRYICATQWDAHTDELPHLHMTTMALAERMREAWAGPSPSVTTR